MKNAFLIAGRELGSYLRTPSGYIIAAAMLAWQALMLNGYAFRDDAQNSTENLIRFLEIAGGTAIVTAALFSLRLLAEERSTGTQTLLFTSPVKEGEIVAGKYLSSLIFLVIVIALSLYMPALIQMKGKVSWGHIGAGYLGIFLLGASTLALGMLASSLVKHPFLAVILTLVFVALLFVAFFVGAQVDGPLGELIIYFSQFHGHYRPSFVEGLIRLSDIVFFVTLSYVCLMAATRVLKGQRWR
ncbi:MAG: ABC transporter permease [Myxococcota bacterium]